MAQESVCNKYAPLSQKENAFAQSGSLVHELMEGYAKGWLHDDELSDLFTDYFDDYVTEPFPYNQFADLRESYFSGSYQYLLEFHGFDGYEIVGSEIDFTVPVTENDSLHGFIDLLLRDKKTGKLVLRDYKSKAKFKNKEEKAHYARQLYLYCIYLQQKYGEYPDMLEFIMFRKQNEEKIPFDMKAFEEARQWMCGQIDKIKKLEEYPAKYDRFFCNNLCNFADSCPEKKRIEAVKRSNCEF